jgi:ribosomal protein S18 acetylase RimI-like enzyme
MREDYKIITEPDPGEAISILEERIYEYNSEKVSCTDGLNFAQIIRNAKNEIIAGIGGWTWNGACEITQLWVNENHREKGFGKKLLGFAEGQAQQKNCSIMLVKSYSFQAPEFYQKHGYKVEHILENFPRGHNYYTLTKRLN